MPTLQHSASPVRLTEEPPRGARIKVVGVGGAGNNALNRMISSSMEGVEFIALNTDIQALRASRAEVREQIGARLTNGLGAGSDPDIGRRAALDDSDKILEALDGADMIFVTAGLGGGTGTGAAPVIAALASEMGALTVAIVTKPFGFEGKRRMAIADWGIHHLLDYVDTLIVIPNEKLLDIAKDAPFFESFRIADDFLRDAVQGISDIITTAGVINRDFADVKAIMAGMGYAVMGTASRSGPARAVDAVLGAVASPLLESGAIDGARGILINITGSSSLRLSEVNDASTMIQSVAYEDANIIFGAVLDERLGDEVKVTVIATGFRNDGRDRSVRRARMTRETEPDTQIIRAAETLTESSTQLALESGKDSSHVSLEESHAIPDQQPPKQEQQFAAKGELNDRQPSELTDQPSPSKSQEGREEAWKDAIRKIAQLPEPRPNLADLADDIPEDLMRSDDVSGSTQQFDTTDSRWISEEDFGEDYRATLSSVSSEPIPSEAPLQYETDLYASAKPEIPLGARPRQAAVAAYTTRPEPEPSRSAPATAFAEILETRRRFIESLTEESPRSNSAIQDGFVNHEKASTFKTVNANVAPPPQTDQAKEPPKPLPEFNRRLNRASGAGTSWELSQAADEPRVRVPSFASGLEDDSYTDEPDELDIPAFLRRGN